MVREQWAGLCPTLPSIHSIQILGRIQTKAGCKTDVTLRTLPDGSLHRYFPRSFPWEPRSSPEPCPPPVRAPGLASAYPRLRWCHLIWWRCWNSWRASQMSTFCFVQRTWFLMKLIVCTVSSHSITSLRLTVVVGYLGLAVGVGE
jgi:hypothetical protein